MGGEWFSVEKIDVKKKFQAGYNLFSLKWNGRWVDFDDVSSIYSVEEQNRDFGSKSGIFERHFPVIYFDSLTEFEHHVQNMQKLYTLSKKEKGAP